MHKYRSVHNDELLGEVHYRLQKRIDLIESVNDKFDKIESIGGERSDAITLGTNDNLGVLLKSGAVPAVPLALGVGSLVLGFVTLIPSAFPEPNMTQAQLEAIDQLKNAGESMLYFTEKTLGAALKLSALPLTVVAISVPKKVARILAGKFEEKTYAKIIAVSHNIDSMC